jgi:hypothetical protein
MIGQLTIMEEILIDKKIWQLPNGSQRTKEEWSGIVDYLVKTLEDYLQQGIDIVDDTIETSIVDNEALCCSIRSAVSFGGSLAVAWEGRLGMELIEDKPCVSASIFLFSLNKRLNVAGQGGSYLELIYEQSDNGNGGWRSLGWMEDIYGEFENIDEYSGKVPI